MIPPNEDFPGGPLWLPWEKQDAKTCSFISGYRLVPASKEKPPNRPHAPPDCVAAAQPPARAISATHCAYGFVAALLWSAFTMHFRGFLRP
jgi:hypothetical protein